MVTHMPSRRSYDYVIAGAGSAGCVLAARLTEDRGAEVLLLEAGGWDRDPFLHIPLGWPRLLLNRLHDWDYFAEPEVTMGGRAVECARGKVIGGSSSINAMAWVRGHPGDYERWGKLVSPDWSYEAVLPYFQRQETWEKGATSTRGGSGPIGVREARYRDPLCDAYAAAARAAGHSSIADYNAGEQEGFSPWQFSIRDGRRESSATAYLRSALKRPNLTVVTGALATRILFDGDRATGIEYTAGGEVLAVAARSEVVLAAGVINSPQLLMLSGVGASEDLAAHGIATRVSLPGVGENLQDHMSSHIAYARNGSGPLHGRMRADRIVLDLARCYLGGRGIATDLPIGEMGFVKTSPGEPLPDIQLLFVAAPMTAGPYFPAIRKPYADGFSLRAALLRPESRGKVRLKSADPLEHPRIRQNFLATDKDWHVLRQGMRLAREIGEQAPLRPFIAKEIAPGPENWSDAAIDAHIRATGITVHHPAGTCRMGRRDDPMAVVDPELRLIGARGLRVVDASVMPDLVGGNINAAVIMIAEKAASFIRGPRPACRDEQSTVSRSRRALAS